jgi:copper chaperone NosL
MDAKRFLDELPGLLAITSLFLASCGSAASGPPSIVLDETPCAHCGMLVSDLAFAAAYRIEDGDARVFDEIGCLLRELPSSGARVFVHDYQTSEWLDGDAAFFVRSESIQTPMGGGIVAFSSREAAEKYEGETLRLGDLKGGSR